MHRLGDGNILTQDDKVDKVTTADIPHTKTQVRYLFGLPGYCRKYIQNYASVVTPLFDLTKKGQPKQVSWTELTSRFCDSHNLRLPDFGREFILRTDASDSGLGPILLQTYDGTDFRVRMQSQSCRQHTHCM